LTSLDIQRELNRLEELILDSPRIPLSRRTMIDEEQVLDQLDLIRLSLPEAFHEAESIVRQKDELLDQAEQYAQELIESAERRAAQIMDESMLIHQAELEAQQIRTAVQQECEAVQQQTIAEIERTRRQAQQDLEDMRQQAIQECEEVQLGADEYADAVLRNMEAQMTEMLRVVRNGRQQLHINQPPQPQPQPQPPRPESQPVRTEVQVPIARPRDVRPGQKPLERK
jgi:F0F1-type ATP synthase membrane subunit b/b'